MVVACEAGIQVLRGTVGGGGMRGRYLGIEGHGRWWWHVRKVSTIKIKVLRGAVGGGGM